MTEKISNLSTVSFEKIPGLEGDVGQITLNRPQALNALTVEMCIAIYQQLQQWRNDFSIKAVVITGNGERAFCAGGDIRFCYDEWKAGRRDDINFFWHEYRMNHAIYTFPKPYIALTHGVTMGGGIGVSAHGSYCIAAENLIYAMPETGIGFFPDVGMTYLLPRLPNYYGYYLGLTGNKITAADALAIGAVDAIVPYGKFSSLIVAIAQQPFANNPVLAVDQVINEFKIKSAPAELVSHANIIQRCFRQLAAPQILAALKAEKTAWTEQQYNDLLKKSPTSLLVTLAALQRGLTQTFTAALQTEYHLAKHFLQGHDFFEGIRAAIIDKDRNPQWQPATLAEIKPEMIEAYFKPVPECELSID